MKIKLIGSLIAFFLISCYENNKAYDPSLYLSNQQQDSLIYKTVRYSAKLAPMATHETKFETQFDPYYKSLLQDYRIVHYWVNNDKTNFFFITRKARSIKPMWEGIGGKLIKDVKGDIGSYEEIFRTWKMANDSLKDRGYELFDAMINGKDLSSYYSDHQGDRYIEFPDHRFYFDKEERRWHDRVLDSLELQNDK